MEAESERISGRGGFHWWERRELIYGGGGGTGEVPLAIMNRDVQCRIPIIAMINGFSGNSTPPYKKPHCDRKASLLNSSERFWH